MKTTLAIASMGLLLMLSCGKKSEEVNLETVSADTLLVEDASIEPVSECYEFVQQKDTISLSIVNNGKNITGNLTFKNFEKDSSHGTVNGLASGDTLKLTYTFKSEGSESKRDMYFLKDGITVRMGTGDMQDKDGTMTFTSPKSVVYSNAIVLAKTECK